MIGYLILAIHCLILLLLIILLIMTITVLPIKGHYPYKTIDKLEAELNRLENRVKEIEEDE